MDTTDKEWESFGKKDPYFGVLNNEKFKTKNLNENVKHEFFSSGEAYVKKIISIIESEINTSFKPHRALDFGCGVGRLTIPFAKRAEHIIGLDISKSFLKEATLNTEMLGLTNVDYKVYSDELISPNTFDFINTYIVIQHIAEKRGLKIIESMLNALTENGIAVIHVTFSEVNPFKPQFWKKMNPLMSKFPVINSCYKLVRKLTKGTDYAEPVMLINYYDLNTVFKLLYDYKCLLLHNEFANHGGIIGSVLFIQKASHRRDLF